MAGIGRPTKYDPKYCEELIAHMEEGLSYESFAGRVGVSKQTIYDWEKVNPAFLDAKRIGFEKCRLFWEKLGINNIINESFGKGESRSLNSSVWIFNMKNRFPDEWREKTEVQHEGNPEKPLRVERIDLDERAAQLKEEKE